MRRSLFAVLLSLAGVAVVPAAEPPARNTEVDQAVERALEYLHNIQDKRDGAWRGGGSGKNPAVTSLAVMAFLSAGHVPGEGRYGETVEKGIRWVLSRQQPNGLIASEYGHEMYHHGIATLMLAEVAGMTDGELGREIRKKLEKAVALILKAQRRSGAERGGWRYQVAHVNGSDMSVTGWQLMALRAAKNLGCDVPAEVIERAVDYVRRSFDSRRGGFCYTPNGNLTVACTGTGVLALELCGKDRHRSDESLRAGAFLIRDGNLPRFGQHHFSYSIYYGAQATFQLGDNYWSVYRQRLHQVLLRNQNGNGSWTGRGYDSSFGPAYSTAMAVLALTVEYRFLPIYQRGEEPAEKDR
jgi:squalene cyclase